MAAENIGGRSMNPHHDKLEANLLKYQLFVILQKRAFLPTIGVYLVSVGKLSLSEIASIASITAIVRLVMEIPTGHFADRFGRKRSTMIGSFIASFSPVAYIVSPNYFGGLAGSVLYFGGWAFVSGAHHAFIHDTMEALGRVRDYAKFRGRAQSYSLLGNILIISLVPMTYEIDRRLPFLFGFIFLFSAFLLACSYTEVAPRGSQRPLPRLKNVLRVVAPLDLLVIFSIYGIISSVFDNAQQFREILFSSLQIPYKYFGPILALGSLLAAVMGHAIHKLADLPPLVFHFVDIFFVTSSLILVGISNEPYLVIFGFLFISMYDRNRAIVAESHLLAMYRSSENKSTLLSVLNAFPFIHGLWVPLAMGASFHFFGISRGYIVFGYWAGAILLLCLVAYTAMTRMRPCSD